MNDHEFVFDYKNKILSIDGVNLFDDAISCDISCREGASQVTVQFRTKNVKFVNGLQLVPEN